MDSDLISAIAAFIGVIFTLLGIYVALDQYKKDNRFKKAAYFSDMRNRFKNNQVFNQIREAVNAGQNLNQFTQTQIYDYAGFFEELQIAINSKFIHPDMIYYLFGHYILEFANNNDDRIQLEVPLWSLLNILINRMREIENQQLNHINLNF
jgi:hypothetical protein